jgi:hypothetical protein
MLLICFNIKSADTSSTSALSEMLNRLDGGNKALEEKFCKALDLFMTWLFLNARNPEEKTDQLY